ncbi:MAG TPA: hypothetical protein VGH93_04635, partial [Solirubrobacteraceae bacterium]
MSVVGERLLVGVELARSVSRGLGRLERLYAQRLELGAWKVYLLGEVRGASVVLGQQRHHLLASFTRPLLDERCDL